MRRLLIIKLSSLGDIVHALPVAGALGRQFPGARITWAVEERFAALVQDHPAIDRVVTFPRFAAAALDPRWPAALRRALAALRTERYDTALDLQGLFKSAVVALASRAPRRIGVAPRREGAALVSRAVPLPAGPLHAVDRYLRCAAFLGAQTDRPDFALRAQPAATASLAALLRRRGVDGGRPLIVLSPSAARAWKNWPDERWAATAAALRAEGSVLLAGAADQRLRHRRIAARAGDGVVDLSGETTLGELIALLDRCALHVAPDTGTLHVAAALGRPLLGIFGPTAVRRLGPYGRLGDVIDGAAECWASCPRLCTRRRACLRAVEVEAVVARARRALRRAPAPPHEQAAHPARRASA